MKAFVLAEHSDAAQELCAGARTMADEVVLVAIADMEVPAAVADKVLHVAMEMRLILCSRLQIRY